MVASTLISSSIMVSRGLLFLVDFLHHHRHHMLKNICSTFNLVHVVVYFISIIIIVMYLP